VDRQGHGVDEPKARWPSTEGEDWCGEYESALIEEQYEDEEEYEGEEWADDGSPAW
jgi:hypothetical protein